MSGNTLDDFRAVQDAGSSPATSLPELPFIPRIKLGELMYRDTCDSIMFKWAFQQCRDFRG